MPIDVVAKSLDETEEDVAAAADVGADGGARRARDRRSADVSLWAARLRALCRRCRRRCSGSSRSASMGASTRARWSHEIFPSPRNIKFNEMEYAVPAANGSDCIREIAEVIRTRKIAGVYPLEFRFVKADDIWLSPFYKRDAVTISVHQYRAAGLQDAVRCGGGDLPPLRRAAALGQAAHAQGRRISSSSIRAATTIRRCAAGSTRREAAQLTSEGDIRRDVMATRSAPILCSPWRFRRRCGRDDSRRSPTIMFAAGMVGAVVGFLIGIAILAFPNLDRGGPRRSDDSMSLTQPSMWAMTSPSVTLSPSLDDDVDDRAGDRGGDGDFHLHAFEDDDRIVLGQALTFLGGDLPDFAGDLGLDGAAGHGFSRWWLESGRPVGEAVTADAVRHAAREHLQHVDQEAARVVRVDHHLGHEGGGEFVGGRAGRNLVEAAPRSARGLRRAWSRRRR